MGSRELLAYALGIGLLVAAILFVWRIRHGQRRTVRDEQKNVRIDLMRRPETQTDEEADGSR